MASCANEKAVGVVKLEDAWLQNAGSGKNGETLQQLVIIMERANASLSEVDFQSKKEACTASIWCHTSCSHWLEGVKILTAAAPVLILQTWNLQRSKLHGAESQ